MPAVVCSKNARTVVVDSTRTAAIAERRPARLSVSDQRTAAAIEQRTSTTEVSSPGVQGRPGPAGEGEPGAPGASAYEVAVANGFEGTEAEWLESLKGDPGEDGAGGGTDAFVPFLVADGEVFVVPANRQAAYFEPIELEGAGALQLEGDLVDLVPVVVPEASGDIVRILPSASFSVTISPEDSGAVIRCEGDHAGAMLIDFAGGPYQLGQRWEVGNYLDSGGISVIATDGGIQFNVPEGLTRAPDNWGEKRTYTVGHIDTDNDVTYIDVTL